MRAALTPTRIFACGLFFVVFGSRLWVIARYGSAIPFWDQWDAEADLILRPLVHGSFPWNVLFRPHNEHRILFSRLAAIGLFELNQQWDPLLEMTFSAGLAAAAVAAFFLILSNLTVRSRDALLACALAILFSLPYGLENTLAGFQTSFWFLQLFSLLAIWLMLTAAAFSGAWWAGMAIGVANCFTMASGFFPGAAILSTLALRSFLRRRRPTKEELATGSAAVIIIMIGLLTRNIVAAHAGLAAHSIADFLSTLFRCLAWPFVDAKWCALILWLPAALVIWQLFRRRADPRSGEILFGYIAWVVLQALGISTARSAGGGAPASRYFDLLACSIALNLTALLLLYAQSFASPALRALLALLAAGWLGFTSFGLAQTTLTDFETELPNKSRMTTIETENVKRYLADNDLAALRSKAYLEIPYPSADRLASILEDPELRKVLPAELQPPISIESARQTCFVPDGTWIHVPRDPQLPSWGSYGAKLNADQCEFESKWFVPTTSFLLLELSGYLDDGRMRLTIQGDNSSVVVHPRHAMREQWGTVVTSVPRGRIRIFAQDGDAEKWFAFRDFHALGRLSYYAIQLRSYSGIFCLAGIVLFFLATQKKLFAQQAP